MRQLRHFITRDISKSRKETKEDIKREWKEDLEELNDPTSMYIPGAANEINTRYRKRMRDADE